MWWALAVVGVFALGRKVLGRGHPRVFGVKPPEARSTDWLGWVWPVPIWNGREPMVTQEWKPGHDPGAGHSSGAHENHLGVDIMFHRGPNEPAINIPHSAQGPYVAPRGTPVIAAGPGKIWATGWEPVYGHWIIVDHGIQPAGPMTTFYQHLESYERQWKKGDPVQAGTVLGRMGYAPGDPEGLRHLHFETRFHGPGVSMDESRLDPQPYMQFWSKLAMKD